MAALVALWQTLSSTQRDNWTNYALNTPRSDQFGTIILTGQQMFVACNTPRVQAGAANVATAPILFGSAAMTPPVPTGLAASVLTFTFTNTDLWATAVGGFLMVYISRPQAATVNYFTGPYRFAGKVSGAVVPPTSPGTATSPFAYATGQRCHVQFRALQADGRISPVARATILSS
jgi:hypothetical protein